MKTSSVKISFEQHEIWRVSHTDNAETADCPYCGEDSPMIKVEKLAATIQTSPIAIYRLIFAGGLHFLETPQKQVFVCLNSFSERSVESNERENLVRSKDI